MGQYGRTFANVCLLNATMLPTFEFIHSNLVSCWNKTWGSWNFLLLTPTFPNGQPFRGQAWSLANLLGRLRKRVDWKLSPALCVASHIPNITCVLDFFCVRVCVNKLCINIIETTRVVILQAWTAQFRPWVSAVWWTGGQIQPTQAHPVKGTELACLPSMPFFFSK